MISTQGQSGKTNAFYFLHFTQKNLILLFLTINYIFLRIIVKSIARGDVMVVFM